MTAKTKTTTKTRTFTVSHLNGLKVRWGVGPDQNDGRLGLGLGVDDVLELREERSHSIYLKIHTLTRPEKVQQLRKKGLKGSNRNFGLN